MYWIIGTAVIFIVAFIIIKLTINTKKNPDSNLGILDHPSTYKRQNVEMVDESLKENTDFSNMH
ncbi:hypothetical protein [Ichthyenterobacterium magnum]|uniref:Uncharacterized protein n=1 Tax=Ichthyenterobacterium magnum TaxID=1230530 RepID=A0A420DXI1_9FLAO|nr:hypothetical protein [Ichthyenterobacterium magnum]RKE98948.1 hypothetical protein BXY80_1043 [Ichthyenterobacterium magnum]